jgi:hypothetical protein
LEFTNNLNHKLVFGVVYNHPGHDIVKNLRNTLSILVETYDDIIIMGDLNVNMTGTHANVGKFKDFITSFNISNVSYLPTNFTHNSSTCIDLTLVRNISKVLYSSQVNNSGISSHDLIYGSYDYNLNDYKENNFIFYRNIRNINIPHLLSLAHTLDWNLIYRLSSVDDMVNYFNELIIYLLNTFAPLRKINLSNKSSSNFRFSDNLQILANKRDFFYSCWKKYRTDECRRNFKTARNAFNSGLDRERRRYDERRYNPSLPPKVLFNRLRNDGIIDNKITTLPSFSPDEFNKYFESNFYRDTSSSFDLEDRTDGFSFRSVDVEEIDLAFRNIHSNAIGLDGIPIKFVQMLLPVIMPFIQFIINSCITKSIFPKPWKISKIIPCPKNSKPSQISDYRPISILSSLSKVCETVLKFQLIEYLESNNFLCKFQSGFRRSFSTTSALLNVIDTITGNLDGGMITPLVLLDFSKAFDSMSHSILINKLHEQYNFSNSSLKFIFSYLSHRIQKVMVGDVESGFVNVMSGVPQGGILSTILFSLFINDIGPILYPAKYHLYADDAQLMTASLKSNTSDSILKMNASLTRVIQWSNENRIALNPNKSKLIIFSNTKINLDLIPSVIINDTVLTSQLNIKNLGIIFDNKLSFVDHAVKISGEVYSTLRRLWATGNYLSTETRKRLVKSLILPKFIYGAPILLGASRAAWNHLNLAFNSCARYVYRKRRYDHISIYVLRILGCSLESYVKYLVCVFIFKLLLYEKPDYLYEKFTFVASNRSQYQNGITVGHFRTRVRERTFWIQGLRLWNSLDPRIRALRSLPTFAGECFEFFSMSN